MNHLKIILLISLFSILFFHCSQDSHGTHDHDSHQQSEHGDNSHSEKDSHAGHDPNNHQDHSDDEAHDDHSGHTHRGHEGHEEDESKYGESMAITWADEELDTFELSERFMKMVDLKVGQLSKYKRLGNKVDTYLIPKNMFVESKNDYGIYKITDKKVKLVKVKLIKKEGNNYLISSWGLSDVKHFVTSDVPILRAAELQVFGEGGHAHAH